MNKFAIVAFSIAGISSFCESAHAQGVTIGRPLEVFADPSDVVIGLDTAGNCQRPGGGTSGYFHIPRSNANFRELTAAALSAHSSGKRMRLFVASCSGDRNILSHGSVMN